MIIKIPIMILVKKNTNHDTLTIKCLSWLLTDMYVCTYYYFELDRAWVERVEIKFKIAPN